MKKAFTKLCVVFLLALCLPVLAKAQSAILNDLPQGDGVSKMYINKSMIQLGADLASSSLGQYKDIFKEIEGIEIYSCDKGALARKANDAFQKVLKKRNIETMVYNEEKKEISAIYTVTNNQGQLEGMIIYNYEPGELSIIVIHGNIDIEALSSMAGLIK